MISLTARDVGFAEKPQPFPTRFSRVADGRYSFAAPMFGLSIDVRHVRREFHQLKAALTVSCSLHGVQTFDGVLLEADVNLSNLRDRDQLAKMLATRTATAKEIRDWHSLVDELSVRVTRAEELGAGAVNLRDVTVSKVEQFYRVERLLLPKRHPALFFGDGDSLKTYLADFLLLQLVQQGVRVAIADWEMTESEHRDRANQLGVAAPDVLYIPCARPLVHEAERITGFLHDYRADYLLLDSAAPACNGRPEDAENVTAYFRALRALGVGSLTIAHSNRSTESDLKPFGSVYWFNLARAIWNVKRAEATSPDVAEIGLYPRKFNLGPMPKASAYRFHFADGATDVRSVDISDVAPLAAKLGLKERMAMELRSGAKTIVELSKALDDDGESISRTLRRYSGTSAKVQLFTKVLGNKDGVHRWGLIERRTL